MDRKAYSVAEAATTLSISRLALEDFTQFMYENGSVGPVEVDYD